MDRVTGRVEHDIAGLGLAAALLGALVGGDLGLVLLALAEGLRGGDAQERGRDDAVVNHCG